MTAATTPWPLGKIVRRAERRREMPHRETCFGRDARQSRDGAGLTRLASQQQCFAVQAEVAGSPVPVTGLRLHRCVSQQFGAFRKTSNACVCVTEQSRERRQKYPVVQLVQDGEALLEPRYRALLAARDSWIAGPVVQRADSDEARRSAADQQSTGVAEPTR